MAFVTVRRAIVSRSRDLANRSRDLAGRSRGLVGWSSGQAGRARALAARFRVTLSGPPAPRGPGGLARTPRQMAVVTLVLLNIFAILAGPTLAELLRAKAIAASIPRVAGRAAVRPGAVLGGTAEGSAASGPEPTAAGLSSALSPILSTPALGRGVGAVVADPATGRVLFAANRFTPATPASTTKLVTSAAALTALGPAARFSTRVVRGAAPGDIILVGGGDPTLAAGHPPASQYPQPATLAGLAAATARALRAQHLSRVRLGYDTSLFAGPPLAPGWTASYVNSGNVTPITSLEVDEGRLTGSGTPEDADDPGSSLPRSWTPAADAAWAFASFLAADGITVEGRPGPAQAPSRAAEVARVQSPPLSDIVEWMLGESNNVIAEFLARQVALATGRPATFNGAAAAVMDVARRLGVPAAEIHLVDGSGLSPDDQIAPAALVQVVALAAAPGRPALRSAVTGMPVSGFSGTLASGAGLFGNQGAAALGVVRAKTGNLDTVASLAGLADDHDGRLLAFAIMAGRVPGAANLQAAADAVNRFAAAVAACGCR
jgi:D-alanyl-D-alanine carboxypeptidase/D-alanyl-D-alanine-endopeptidase (penicillin-binding protein 4)